MGVSGYLTTEQKQYLQDRINFVNGIFQSHVISNRGMVQGEVMQGQDFYGIQAVQNNLVDGIVSSLGESISMLDEIKTTIFDIEQK
jgi:ClpP class serine protease